MLEKLTAQLHIRNRQVLMENQPVIHQKHKGNSFPEFGSQCGHLA